MLTKRLASLLGLTLSNYLLPCLAELQNMILNMKLLSVLVLTLMSLVAGNPGLRTLKKKKTNPITLKVFRGGEEGDPDEVDLGVKLKSCKKSDEKCLESLPEGKEVTKEEFTKKLADDMMGALEEDEDEENKGNRNLGCYDSYYADAYYYYWSWDCW